MKRHYSRMSDSDLNAWLFLGAGVLVLGLVVLAVLGDAGIL